VKAAFLFHNQPRFRQKTRWRAVDG
jgi:hypothetical protein